MEQWDPLHSSSHNGEYWTRTNLAEAMPGVLTPLGWTLWGCNAENAGRGVIYAMGGLTRAERRVPDDQNRWTVRPFYGRPAWQVDFFATIGDRMPGTSAEKAVMSLLGRMPEGIESHPTRRFYPRVAWRMPKTVLTSARSVRKVARATEDWYRTAIRAVPAMDGVAARRTVAEADTNFGRVLMAQGRSVFALIMPVYDALDAVVRKAGVGDVGILSGSGGAELAMLEDLWRASRGELPVGELLLRHGFHGPDEGEVSSTPWREDPTPLRRMLDEYGAMDRSDSPTAKEEAARGRLAEMRPQVVAAFPVWQQPPVRLVLALAARIIPLRGVAKRSMLQCIDGCRAAARRLGELLVADGLLDEPGDVFYLTVTELAGALPADAKELVRKRRERRDRYRRLVLPGDWRGVPEPSDAQAVRAATQASVEGLERVTGMGVSRGVVEGPARVVMDADFGIVEPGEILVAPTTDPGWASIMFVSSGLVVDIGSALSHAAIVARELGIPCVVNTQVGTTLIRTGDIVRLDGDAGTVQIVKRATTEGAGC